ncbi:MAG TPA: DUF1385 domain-containing protein [Solirubrobacteraceae bacterium]|jgi:uncharacterized protein YqhQ
MLQAQRDAPLGGQAVLEGVMMRGIRNWAVAVRKPAIESALEAVNEAESAASANGASAASGNGANAPGASGHDAVTIDPVGEIEVTTFPLDSALRRHRWLRVPVLRGIVALGESLGIGFKALGVSANAQLAAVTAGGSGGEHEGEDGEAAEPMEISGGMWAGTIVVALVFAIGLFFLLPLGLTSLIKGQLHSSALFWIVEGILRTAIFLGYMLLLSRLRDLRRVFEYHGAEHKTISCFEAGLDLTPQNAQRFSRLHPRCGTSFLLIVMIVSIFVFGAVGLPAWYLLVASRIIGVPLIAGISFEIIKFAGRNRRRRWVRAVMWPGMQLQLLTTREPDLDQLAVAIASLQAVLALEDPTELSAKDLVGVEVVA